MDRIPESPGRRVEEPLLEVVSITKLFGGVRAIDSVSFTVEKGAIASLIGPNGAGKSTLFNLVSAVLRPTSGRVLFRGQDVTGWPSHRIVGAGLTRTFQAVQLFPTLTILENVLAGRLCRTSSTYIESVLYRRRHRREHADSRLTAEHLLAELGVYERRHSFPRELAYGDQRRAEIARALATDPQMLLLDEPSQGLSHRETGEFMDLIARLNVGGLTLLVIEHNMKVVMDMSAKVIVMNFGKKIAEGAPVAIQNDAAVLAAYLGSSTR